MLRWVDFLSIGGNAPQTSTYQEEAISSTTYLASFRSTKSAGMNSNEEAVQINIEMCRSSIRNAPDEKLVNAPEGSGIADRGRREKLVYQPKRSSQEDLWSLFNSRTPRVYSIVSTLL